ncbi:MAG: peptide ligase PGM1-related protein [Nocardioides sp.]
MGIPEQRRPWTEPPTSAGPVAASRFADLQSRLADVLALHQVGSTAPHVRIELPSYSMAPSILAHYAPRLAALEHRYLLSQLVLPRMTGCEVLFVTCAAPGQDVLDYYFSLLPPDQRAAARRLQVLVVPDASPRPVTAKLLDRPDLVDELRRRIAGRPAFIEPWNVSALEVELASKLGVPVNGTDPTLWPIAFKSAGRRILADAGIPTPVGREDVRTVDDVVEAVAEIRARRPTARGVVVKTDDSGAGDGNQIIRLSRDTDAQEVRRQVELYPDWYLADLRLGGVVEELVSGTGFSSPSVQVEIPAAGEPVVCTTHEQVLGGPSGQVYFGCRFPAHRGYAGRLGAFGRAVGDALAARGAVGRFSVDFVVVRSGGGRWDLYALEINLRKGGTTHPFAALHALTSGRYDVRAGTWLCDDGSRRFYEATDNLVDPEWLGRSPSEVIRTVAAAGLEFDRRTGVGVVLHMLSGLAVDGRLGLTAIGRTRSQAARLCAATVSALAQDRASADVALPLG